MCEKTENGQNGHGGGPGGGGPGREEPAGDDPYASERAYLNGLIERHGLRNAAQMTHLRREAARKIADGTTRWPHPGTLAKIRDSMERHRRGTLAVAEDRHPSTLPTPADLRVALPEGRDEAHAHIKSMMARLKSEAAARGAQLDPHDEPVASFLSRCVDALYAGEPTIYELKKPGRGRPPRGRPPGGPRRKAPPGRKKGDAPDA